MRVSLLLLSLSFLLPQSLLATNITSSQRVPATGIADKGELIWSQNVFSYQPWNSAKLTGKVRIIQHIAGRSSAKEMNAALIEAIKAANLTRDGYQTTTIVNVDDAIPGTGLFVRNSIRSSKQRYPWSQFIVDSDGLVRKAWDLQAKTSAIIVLDKNGKVRFIKEGALSASEVQQVMTLVHELLCAK
ncbi:YtfJ family protein [Enterobacteriaceae bacterium LUAb1]